MSHLVSAEHIERKIHLIRGHRVMLDFDIAELYQVPTKRINEQVRRNRLRFPSDFMFRLTPEETMQFLLLRSQNAILETNTRAIRMRSHFATASKRNIRFQPYAFTEQGVAMLSGILSSQRAINVNVAIMRAFVKLRQLMSTHQDLMKKIKRLESKYDAKFRVVFVAIRELMTPRQKRRKEIGFRRP